MKYLDLFVLAIGVAAEPFPMFAFILLLVSRHGTRKGIAFIIGWLLSLVGVIAIVMFATGGKGLIPKSAPSVASICIKLVLGLILILWGFRLELHRHSPKNQKTPKWLQRLDGMHAVTAAGLGAFLQPWVVVAAGAAVIANAKWNQFTDYLTLFLFIVLSTSTFITMMIYALCWPQQATVNLARLRRWIETHRIQMEVGLVVVIGLYLVGFSIVQLVR